MSNRRDDGRGTHPCVGRRYPRTYRQPFHPPGRPELARFGPRETGTTRRLTLAGACNVPRARRVLPLKHSHQYGRKKIVARTFKLDTTVGPSSLLARAKKAAYLVGDEWSGRFSHEMVRGDYRMSGQAIIVTVTKKRWLLPWPLVEAQLRELVL